jgi:hypothetical protein
MFRATVLPIIRSIRLYEAPNELSAGGHQATGRQLIGCFIPQAALYSLMLLMGKTVARKMLNKFEIINKIFASFWPFPLPWLQQLIRKI